MNHRKPGTNISNFGNFTFHSNDNNSSNKITSYNSNFPNEQIKRQGFGKATKRAPLGELQLNCVDNGYTDASQLPQILPKKRAERFEIFIEEDGSCKEKKESMVLKSEQSNFENEAGKPEVIPFEKKNIPPAIENSVKETDSPLEKSSDEETDEEETPSEYLTARSCFSNFTQSEKNTMYISYDLDIYRWMLHQERINRPKSSYMSKQSQINEEMRAVLVDWYIDVIAEYELSSTTFFLAVSLTDRSLSVIDCPRDKLQLLGATAILIASKMHEIFPPLIKDVIFITDESYNDEQVRRMEKIILKVIDFQLNNPLVDSFAEFFNYFAPDSLDEFARYLMWYLLELCTLEFNFVRYLPSRLAAAAFLLASTSQRLLNQNGIEHKIWSDEMVKRTNITRGELSEPAFDLIQFHQRGSNQTQSIRKKYASSKRCKVSHITLPEFGQIVSQFSDAS